MNRLALFHSTVYRGDNIWRGPQQTTSGWEWHQLSDWYVSSHASSVP